MPCWSLVFDLTTKSARISEIEAQMEDPSFWKGDFDPELMKERSSLQHTVKSLKKVSSLLAESREFLDWEGVDLREIKGFLDEAESIVKAFELDFMFSGPDDTEDALVSIHVGTGGTESQYWVEVLFDSYLRYAQSKNWSIQVLDKNTDSEVGLKSVSFAVKGEKAYGHLKVEKGPHRFCRQSPFDSSGKVHTSFVAVDVIPYVENDEIEIELDDSDLEISTYRSSGPGGQHANKADSAVRIKHLPSGIVVQCQMERSQHKNKRSARKLLKAQLREHEKKKKEAEYQEEYNAKSDSSFGHQIRSYELHKNAYVKDHRSGYVSHQPDKVFEGQFEGFIESCLMMNDS